MTTKAAKYSSCDGSVPTVGIRVVFLLVISCFLFCVYPGHCARSKGVKRIVNGEGLADRNSGYLVTNYFVSISNKHICGAFDSFNNFLNAISIAEVDFFVLGVYKCDVVPNRLMCGGALITPKIVQTACHCVGTATNTEDEDVQRYLAKDAFTDMALIYHGSTTTDDMHTGYLSQMFLVHQKCHLRRNIIIHDYGLIILKTGVAPDANFASNPRNFAPVYEEETVRRLWNDVNGKESVCLFVGFGWVSEKDENPIVPSVLQHMWAVMQNYRRCFVWTNLRTPGFNYTTDGTWSCYLTLPSKYSRANHGDSGSPVTCNNEYFGFVSATVPKLTIPISYRLYRRFRYTYRNLDQIAPIIYSTLVNTVENRGKLVERMEEILKETEEARRLDPSPRKLPPRERTSDGASNGPASLGTIYFPLVLTTLFALLID